MIPRRAVLLPAFFLSAALLPRSAAADDQAAAAAAVAQAVGQAVPGAQGAAAGGAVGAAAGAAKTPPPGTSGGHFGRQLGTPQIMPKSGRHSGAKIAPGKKGKKGSSKASKDAESKYKSRALVENTDHAYRFDESGEPIDAAAKLKSSSALKKKAPAAPDEKDVKAGACSSDEPCNVKNPDADAL
jgi:hypothetical protein